MKPWREADDAQLRRAAAERVMGWVAHQQKGRYASWIRWYSPGFDPLVSDWELEEHEWRPDQDRDDLARVVLAASERFGPIAASIREDQSVWGMALRDPRAALVLLLELLFPEGMNDA